jgi:MFS family permease
VVSSPFWGAFADTTAKTVMVWSAVIAAVTAGLVLVLPHVVAGEVLAWAFAPAFLALGVAEAGVRLGRKTYLADGAPTDERPLYAAFANTATGLVAIGFAGLGIVAEMTGVASVVGVLGAISALAIVLSLAMPQAERMAESED